MRRAVVDLAEVELTVRAKIGPGGHIAVQDALIRRAAGGRPESAAVLAWARRRGARPDEPWWVLAVWMDTVNVAAEGGAGRVLAWRGGWLDYEPALLEPSEPWRQTTEYWHTQRAEAIQRTLQAAGVRPAAPDARVLKLETLAGQVREAVAAFRLPADRDFLPPRFRVWIDAEHAQVVLDLREWTSWGPRRALTTMLEERFPAATSWASSIRFPVR